ncbi:MAG: hypothetical protein FWD64_02800 [Acidobacteriaceae bacterium]|nr:hypothetical protein [Acidobacteriaceae bacterium]
MRRRWLVLLAFAAFATPAFALFGLGDVVFDPTSYGELITQTTTAYNQLQTALSQLQTIQNNLRHFSIKNQWRTLLSQIHVSTVHNTYGETANMSTALNTNSPTAAASAWQNATVESPTQNAATLAYIQSLPSDDPARSQLAFIETSDSISPDCLIAVGQYRDYRTQNTTANQSLSDQQYDTGDGTNSEVQQLNLMNAAQAQTLTEMQAQGSIQTCLASAMAVQNMQQRNAAAHALRMAALIQQQHQTANNNYQASTDTWTTALP